MPQYSRNQVLRLRPNSRGAQRQPELLGKKLSVESTTLFAGKWADNPDIGCDLAEGRLIYTVKVEDSNERLRFYENDLQPFEVVSV